MNRFFQIFLVFCLLALTVPAANPVSVPLHHPVYEFIDRMESLRKIENIRSGVKPFTRGYVAKLLSEIDQSDLTPIDRQRLQNFLLDFRFEISTGQKYAELSSGQLWYSPLQNWGQFKKDFNRYFLQNQPEEQNHACLWESGTNSFYLDFIADMAFDFDQDNRYRFLNSQRYYGYGTLNTNFGYAFDVTLLAVHGDTIYRDQHPALKDAWFKDQGGKVIFDRTGAEIAYDTPYLTATFAQQPVSWGTGESGSLLISDYAEQFPYFGLNSRWSWGTFSVLHGKLLHGFGGDSLSGQPYYPDKYIAAHRLEISPWQWLDIGFTEAVIYGNRGVDWAYLLPLNFYRAAEHGLEDRDNKTISIDFNAVPACGYNIYGSVFLDEFKQSEIGTNWYGNKHAFLGGLYLVDPGGLNNLALRIEYAAVMPWVYTHKISYNRFTTSNRSLGYWAGPNSQVWYAHIKRDWHHRLSSGVKFRQWKHGENYTDENIGGNIDQGYNVLLGNQQQPRTTRRFLEGVLSTYNYAEIYLQYEPFNDLFLNLSYSGTAVETGPDTEKQSEIHFGIKFDY